MSASRQKWLRGLRSASLLRPAPQNANQKHTEILAYVELLGQFVSESFVDDIGELVRSHYPSQEDCLLDDVLATFVLHHPEHGHAVLHALLSCVIDGTIIYDKNNIPFRAFLALFSPSTEREFSDRWSLACGEILRVLTHYNRPTFKTDNSHASGSHGSPSTSGNGSGKASQEDAAREHRGRNSPARLLTPWITDSLLAASSPIRNDYFCWCGEIMEKYAGGEELRPPTTVGQGKQPKLVPSSPRWAVANGAAVILSVCDDEVDRYQTADLTASAVPALLIRPPPRQFQEEMVVLSLPTLEPFARLFHRYYSIATPGATQRLLLGLLEAPPVGAPHGLLVAVTLLDILRVADEGCSSVQLPRDWLHRHFLKPIGAAMATKSGTVADAAASLLYHIFSQPAILVPQPPRSHGVSETQSMYRCATKPSGTEEVKSVASQASEEATAEGLAALMVGHGPDVEWRICMLWEAALGLRPLSPHVLDLPKLVISSPLQPPVLSWSMVRPLLCTLEYLPAKSESRDCLRRIFSGTAEAILQRTFRREDGSQKNLVSGGGRASAKLVGMAELRAMVHCLFTEPFLTPNLATQLLSDALTICLSHDAKRDIELRGATRNGKGGGFSSGEGEGPSSNNQEVRHRHSGDEVGKNRGAVATFDSYIVAAVCALACEVRFLAFSSAYFTVPKHQAPPAMSSGEGNGQVGSSGGLEGRRFSLPPGGFPIAVGSVAEHSKRLGLLELLLTGSPSASGPVSSDDTETNDIFGQSVVAAHMSSLLGQSRACLHSLTEIMKCEWDPGICKQAAAVVSRIEINGSLVSGSSQGRSWRPSSEVVKGLGNKGMKGGSEIDTRELDLNNARTLSLDLHRDSTLQKSPNRGRMPNVLNGQREKSSNGFIKGHMMGKQVANLPLEAADLAALLCKERNGRTAVVTASLQTVIVEKQHLAIGAVALLCQRLVCSPEILNSTEGTSAERGWHQVVEALCNVAAALPENVAPFIVAQAETQLQPWTGKDDVRSEKSVWRVNIRIVSLLSALLRLRSIPFIVKVVVRDGALLRRATDGLTMDGEACTLPQLELLEAAAVAAQAALKWDEPRKEIADLLFSLLRDRLPVTVQCLSHSSAHVRAMSIARLRDMLYFESSRTRYFEEGLEEDDTVETGDSDSSSYQWRKAIEQCITWEAHYRRAGGMSISLLANAAAALGFTLPS